MERLLYFQRLYTFSCPSLHGLVGPNIWVHRFHYNKLDNRVSISATDTEQKQCIQNVNY